MTKFLEFECPHCHGWNISRTVEIERSTTVRLLEGGLMTYPGHEHSDGFVDFDETAVDVRFRCEGCLESLRDSEGYVIRTPQSLYAYLLDQAGEEKNDGTA